MVGVHSMSRSVIVCLLLSISQISFCGGSIPQRVSNHLSNMGTVICEKPQINYFSLTSEVAKCQKGREANFAYDQNCLQRVLKKTDRAFTDNLKLIGTTFVADTVVLMTSSVLADLRCSNTAQGLYRGFHGLTVLPFCALVADTWGIFRLKQDIAEKLKK
jgi:hypothetical protein